MAHCGTHSTPFETSYLDTFARLAKDYEHCFGDTAALNLPLRSYAFDLLKDPIVRDKLVHGSDWPIVPIPPLFRMDFAEFVELMHDSNWMRRDIEIKRELGFDDAYWHCAASILRNRPAKKTRRPQRHREHREEIVFMFSSLRSLRLCVSAFTHLI